MMVYKVTFWRCIGKMFLTIFSLIGLIFVFSIGILQDDSVDVILIYGGFLLFLFAILILPSIGLFFYYLKSSKRIIISINNDRFEIRRSNRLDKFTLNQISKVLVYKNYRNKFGNGSGYNTSMYDFYFIKIVIEDGSNYNVTCLMIDDYSKFMTHFESIEKEYITSGLMYIR